MGDAHPCPNGTRHSQGRSELFHRLCSKPFASLARRPGGAGPSPAWPGSLLLIRELGAGRAAPTSCSGLMGNRFPPVQEGPAGSAWVSPAWAGGHTHPKPPPAPPQSSRPFNDAPEGAGPHPGGEKGWDLCVFSSVGVMLVPVNGL